MDDRLYAALVAFARLLLRRRPPVVAQPAPKVLVSVGAASEAPEPEPEVEVLSPPVESSSWAARPSHSKAWLACVLLGELQAGVMLRAVYEVVVRT